MVMAFKNGLMVLFIKVHGKMIRLMDQENLFIQMEIIIKDNGKTIKLKDMVYIKKLMEETTMVNGFQINHMVTEQNSGQMGISIKDSLVKDINMEMEYINGMTVQLMKGNGIKEKLKVMEHILIMMEEFTRDNGKTI